MIPDWNSLIEVANAARLLTGAAAWLSALIGILSLLAAISGVGGYIYSNRKEALAEIAAKVELDRVRNQIHSFTSHLYVEYSWEQPHNPLLEPEPGGGEGAEDHLSFIRIEPNSQQASEIWLKRTSPYTIRRVSLNKAVFETDLILRHSGFPIGAQISELSQLRSATIYVPIKAYWPDQRDTYPLVIERVRVELIINGQSKTYEASALGQVKPVRLHSEVIWGYVTLALQIPDSAFQ